MKTLNCWTAAMGVFALLIAQCAATCLGQDDLHDAREKLWSRLNRYQSIMADFSLSETNTPPLWLVEEIKKHRQLQLPPANVARRSTEKWTFDRGNCEWTTQLDAETQKHFSFEPARRTCRIIDGRFETLQEDPHGSPFGCIDRAVGLPQVYIDLALGMRLDDEPWMMTREQFDAGMLTEDDSTLTLTRTVSRREHHWVYSKLSPILTRYYVKSATGIAADMQISDHLEIDGVLVPQRFVMRRYATHKGAQDETMLIEGKITSFRFLKPNASTVQSIVYPNESVVHDTRLDETFQLKSGPRN